MDPYMNSNAQISNEGLAVAGMSANQEKLCCSAVDLIVLSVKEVVQRKHSTVGSVLTKCAAL